MLWVERETSLRVALKCAERDFCRAGCIVAAFHGFALYGSARVHLVTKPVRRCYLSSLAGARQKLFKSRLTRPDDFTVRA